MGNKNIYCEDCTYYRVYKISEYTGLKIKDCVQPNNIIKVEKGCVEKGYWYCLQEPCYCRNGSKNCKDFVKFKGWFKFPKWIKQ